MSVSVDVDYAINKKRITDIDVRNKTVLLRVDLNVPLDSKLEVKDTTKIEAVLPTIHYLLERNAAIILISHMGRPKGKVEERMRLFPVVRVLEKKLGTPIKYIDKVIGPEVEREIKNLKPKEILLLENIRFHLEEEKNDVNFSKKLASYADVFINDAFGTLHRAHSSTAGVCSFIPSAAGLLVDKEINYFSKIFKSPEKPFSLILGGAKVSTKINLIENIMSVADKIFIGGGMCFTFFKALGYEIGKSLCEEEKLDTALDILKKAEKKGVELILPVDIVVADEITHNANKKIVPINKIPQDGIGVDIGPETIALFRRKLADSRTILWNGPMGVFEVPQFAKGTFEIAHIMAEMPHCTTLVGGGESVMAVNMAEVKDKISHVSTGGGATLEFLEGKKLPGIMALSDK